MASFFAAGPMGEGRMMAQVRDRVPCAIGNGKPSARLTGMSERIIYESSNGDVRALALNPASKLPAVKHQPNASSGGQAANSCARGSGPEHQALRKLIGTLLDD